MEDFKRPQIENVQKSFDRAIAIFSEKTRLNMIDIKDWIGSFALYQAGRKAGLSSQSLVTLASELLTTKIINNRTDLDEVYEKACQLITFDIAVHKSNKDYDEKGMLKPEAAWTDSQKKEMMRFNQVQPLIGMNGKEYYSERDLAKANALYENKQIIKDERPKTLSPNNSSSESGKALSQTLASDFEAYKGGLQQRRDERYQSIIDKLPSIEGPTNRKK